MKKFIQTVFAAAVMVAFAFPATAQTIVKGSGILYTNGVPSHTVNLGVDAEVALDSASGLWYEYNRDAAAWGKAGFRIQHLPISVAPTGAPGDKQSEIVINDVDSLYGWRSGAWRHLNKVWDNSPTNELQTLANTSNATTHTATLSNSGGSVQLAEGSGITLTTTGTSLDGIVTIVAVDASTTNELQTYGHSGTTSYTNTLSGGGGSFTLQSTGIVSINHSAGTVTFTATEVDGSVTNEGLLGVGAGSGTSSVLLSNTSGSTGVTINAAGILAITESTSSNGGSVTLTATEVDGSTSNELQTYGHSGTTTYTNTLSSGGGSWSITGAGIAVISQTAGAITVTATEIDGSTSNELQTYGHSGTTTYTNTLSDGGGSWSITGAGIAVISQTAGAITVTATEVDGSTSNELQTLANTSNSTTHTVTLSNSGGSFQLAEGANITLTTTGTGLDGIITIAATGAGNTDLAFTGVSSPVTLTSSTGSDVTFTAGGINTFSASGTNITITATEVDGSVTNEGLLGVGAGSGTSSVLLSNTSGATGVTINAAGILAITESTSSNGGSVTLTATEVDGSTTNELQTFASTSNATSHTLTLSNSGGSIQLVEGANITLTTTGTGLDGIITIAATSGGGSDLTFTGTSSPVTLNSSSGTDVTFTAGGINSFSASGTNITITATEVDGSTTNELQTYGHSGTTTYTNTLSSGGGSWSITGAGIAVISQTAGAITVTATEVDGSVTNEAWTIDADDADTEVISNQTVKFQGGGIVVTDYIPGTDILTITATEVDGSTSNELQTYGHSGTTTYTNTLSNGGGSWSITGAGIAVISQTAGAITVTATEVDGSVTNEGILGVGAGNGTSSVLLSNTSGATGVTINAAGILAITESTSSNGGSVTLTATEVDGSVTNEAWTIDADDADTEVISNQTVKFQGGGIVVTDYVPGTDILTITATEVDGSTSNELQTYGHSGTTTYTNTLSDGGGSWSITGAGIAVISQTAGAITVTATEVDGSTSNELQTYGHSGTTTYTNTLSSGGGSWSITGAGIAVVSQTAGAITVTATEVDGSVTNEGLLGVGAGSGTSSVLLSNTSGATGVTINAAGILAITESTSSNGGSVTLTATEVDGSTSNELQTLASTSNSTSHTVTLSNTGGSFQLVEGSGITLTTTGTGLDGIITIAATGGGSGDILQNGNSFGAAFVIGTNDNNTVNLEQNGTTFFTAGTDKNVTITNSVAATNTATDRLIIQTNSTGSATNNFGGSILFQGESTTTNNRDMARITSYWGNPTDGSQTGNLGFYLPYNGGTLDATVLITRTGSSTGMLHVGSTTPAQITNTNFFNNTDYVFGGGTPNITMGGSSGGVELLRITSATTAPLDFTIESGSTGTPAAGFGVNLLFQGESNSTNNRDMGSISTLWTTATDASRVADMVFKTVDAATLTERMRLTGAGQLQVPGTIDVDGSGGSATTLTGRDASNVITNITVGSGLSLSGGTLTASGGGGTNIYNSNGTLNSLNRTATIGHRQMTWVATDTVGGKIPFRIISTGNEPELQVWKGNTDSVYIYQSDSEYVLKATASLDINTNQVLTIVADSVVYSGSIGTDNGLATITGLNSVSVAKKLAGTSSGQVVKWNGTEWVAGTDDTGSGGSPVVIRPSSIGSHQNDYAPTDWATANTVFLTASSIYQITGFTATGVSDGEVKTLHNIGTFMIYIPIESTSSTAANRVAGNGGYFLFSNQHVDIIYDATNSRWRFLDVFQPEDVKGPYYDVSPGSTTAGDWGDLTFSLANSATMGTANSSTSIPAAFVPATAASANAIGLVTLGKGSAPNFSITSNKPISFEAFIGINANLSTGTERYSVSLRFSSSALNTITATSQFGIRYADDLNSGKWQLYCVNGSGTLTTTDTGITVAASTNYKLRVDADATGASFNAYIDDVYVGNLAPGTAPATGGVIQAGIIKSAGTSARNCNVYSLTGYQQY